jgi:predicted nucleic acid-binding protein
LSFDLDVALRAIKPQRRRAPLVRRSASDLTWAADEAPIGRPSMLDTTVYVDVLRGRSPDDVDSLLRFRTCNHSAVCLSELTHAFGRLDPDHSDTKSVLKTIREMLNDIPAHRLHTPDDDIWGRAGMLAGMLFRHSGLPAKQGHERRFVNDALLYLQARRLGCAVLTRNIRDFDWLNQLLPSGRVICYE